MIIVKKSFQPKTSETVTLDESKSTALDVIAKLKSKTHLVNISTEDKQPENTSTGIFNDDINLNYDDIDLHLDHKKNESPITSYQKNDENRKPISPSDLDQITPLRIVKNEKKTNFVNDCSLSGGKSKSIFTDPRQINSPKESISSGNINEYKKPAMKTNIGASLNSVVMGFPMLSGFGSNTMIDLNKPVAPKHTDRAKLNAIKLIQKNGPLKKADPNSTKVSGKKRPVEINEQNASVAKKSKLAESEFISDRFKKMMAATSKHLDLLEARDDEEKEKYFNKLEIREKMEEKMTSTFKVACKAVKCLKCKYTSFSASEICKTERHPLKVFDAMKRFFKCGNCGNRTVSLEVVPTGLCKNCGSGKWERTGMMKEKVVVAQHSLSIRGGEQKFVNSVASDTNINLLIPDTGS
ncbi:hypothetical protein NQ314_005482 [Rhamnusium bicolor]|uniref:Replication factor Mcm10 C-terminal domain-containing protein n=1 Tax=Rhamnusium bicolor TaxID=1586634 RepID=A0AAV8ZGX9_9CUCU|nr:hypothetical protein NQ314_005482 [Rhamnusium bicolor]